MMGRRFMFEVILNFLSNTYVGQNIAMFRQNDWFHTIYCDEPYRSLFFANRHVRKYLQLFVKPILEHLYFDHTYFIP